MSSKVELQQIKHFFRFRILQHEKERKERNKENAA